MAIGLSDGLAAVAFRRKLCIFDISDPNRPNMTHTYRYGFNVRSASIAVRTITNLLGRKESGPTFVLALSTYRSIKLKLGLGLIFTLSGNVAIPSDLLCAHGSRS